MFGRLALVGRLVRWRSTRALPELADGLRDCSRSLARHAAATEPGFLALGNDLQSLYRTVTELTQSLEESNSRLHRELNSQRLSGTDGVVAAALREVEEGVGAVETLMKRSRTITNELSAMRPQLDAVNRIGVLLQSVAVGFAVESARDKESQVAFGSFVEEIRVLSRRTTEVEGRIGEQLATACNSESAALGSIEAELGQLAGLSRQLAETSARAASDVQARLDDIVVALDAMRDRSVRIRQHTEEAVFHMQFGDIVRQKIEHVVEAIDAAAGGLSARGSARWSLLPKFAGSLAVQIAQLESVEHELVEAERQLGHSFSEIAESVSGLGASVGGGHHGRTGVVELRGVLGDFDKLRELAVKEQQLREQAFGSGQDAFQTAVRIAGQMQEVQTINREMHLLALNAIVKTAALGEAGATLEVLSMQVHELYRQADAAVGMIGAEAARLTEHRDGEVTEHIATHEADRALVAAVSDIAAGVADYERTVERIGARVADGNVLLEAARERLAQLREFAGHVRSLREMLEGFHRRLVQIAGPVAIAEDGADAAQHYTMESEREIHRRIAAGASLSPAPSATRGASATVAPRRSEIFDTPKAHPPSADIGARPSPPSVPDDAGSLGDNVELF